MAGPWVTWTTLAGTLKLGKLIVLYDSNRITIEGSTDLAFTEDVQARMKAFGFQTIDVKDGNDLAAIGAAIDEAKADAEKYSIRFYSGDTVAEKENSETGEIEEGYINVFVLYDKKQADSSSSPDISRSKLFFKTIDGKRYWDIFH